MTQANQHVSSALFNAFKTHQPIEFISKSYSLNESEAYHTQDDLIKQLQSYEGSKVAGYKVSMTSAATQAIANTNEPAYGTILSSKVVKGGDTISLSKLFSPLLEPEIMFKLTADLPKDSDNLTILSNVKVAAGIEIPDARYIDWFPNFTLTDLISDDTATGLIVVGKFVDPLDYDAFANIPLSLVKDGKEIATGLSNEVLGNPIESVKWLNNKLQSQDKQLKKDQIISSGTFISPLTLEEGNYTASYGEVGSVDITVTN